MNIIQEAEPQPLNVESSRRRLENSKSSKDFFCPCGKSYFSYPALFTHVKQKHAGKPPGELVRPASMSNLKRGRPKGSRNVELVRSRPGTKENGQPDACAVVDIEFILFLIRVSADMVNEISTKCSQFGVYLKYLDGIKFVSTRNPSTCQQILSQFLKEVGLKIGYANNIIHELAILLGLLCRYIDFSYSGLGVANFTQNNPATEIGYFANSFVTHYLPGAVQQEGLGDFEFFKEDNSAKTLMFVFGWLCRKKYCQHYLMIKTETSL